MSNKTLFFVTIVFLTYHIVNNFFYDLTPKFLIEFNSQIQKKYLDIETYIKLFNNFKTFEEENQQLKLQNQQLKLRNQVLKSQQNYLFEALEYKNFKQLHVDNYLLNAIFPLKYPEYGTVLKILTRSSQSDLINYNQIYGVVKNSFAIGILRNNILYLNQHNKTSYSVYIGLDKIPAIIHGKNSLIMEAKFIPEWFDVSNGDEVITSGIDDIFPFGIKVGRVVNVERAKGYFIAEVKPYQTNFLNFPFYTIHQRQENNN